MSEFNKLHEHLRECVDSENDSFIGITEDGVEFNMYEFAFALSVCAKREHDRLVEENRQLREFLESLQLDVSNEIKLEQLLSEIGGE
jgi:hypothetical protein